MSIKVTLPSGAELEILKTPFKESKALYQAMLEEFKALKIEASTEIDIDLWKNMVCVGFASQKIEKCLWECMKRALYNGQKISEDTFESDDARGDYPVVCMEVSKANILPFIKGLSAKWSPLQELLKVFPA